MGTEETERTRREEERELREARDIQRRMLPAGVTHAPGVEIAVHWKPARDLGGDYFDVLRFADGSIGLCIADVEGKGLPAALVMSSLQAAVHTLASPSLPPSALCERLNSMFSQELPAERSISLFYAHLDPARKRLVYTNAGHLPPVVLRRSGPREKLRTGGLVLGRLAGWTYRQEEVTLRTGDVLVLFTDGVSEAQNGAEEEFGEERIAACASATAPVAPAERGRRVLTAVADHCGCHFRDDATLAVLEVA